MNRKHNKKCDFDRKVLMFGSLSKGNNEGVLFKGVWDT